MQIIVLVLAAILVHVSEVKGCSCADSDGQTKYCQSAYVVIARVNDITIEEGVSLPNAGRTYDVQVLNVYKGIVNKGPAKVRTSGVASLCGVGLERKVYLLNGHIQNGEMWINSCSMITFNPLIGSNPTFNFDPNYDCRCKKENILLGVGEPKPHRVCALGNRIRCPPRYYGAPRKLAECRYYEIADDCDWHC
ncbi:uncharacterized protein LOC125677378 [Ostrea edulis]|uniref:uncharacterized protein LOC125677378 n=1 Tax=Ostrea edulis TaxID=37623 RepID=UPI0024AEDF63|nr:uncharacterized protein LOC125677378 [Ostrea edulis]